MKRIISNLKLKEVRISDVDRKTFPLKIEKEGRSLEQGSFFF